MTKQELMDRLMDFGPGDECESTRQWRANVQAFVAASVENPSAWVDAARAGLRQFQLQQDVREEGANVWAYWANHGFKKDRSFAPLFALMAQPSA